MIRSRKRPWTTEPYWHAAFLVMLPKVRLHASIAFRGHDEETREDLVEEAIANAFVAYVRLVERGKADLAYPTVLARYAVAQIRDGRRVGSSLNTREVLSSSAQRKQGFVVEHLDSYDSETAQWREAVVEDHHQTPILDKVAFRLDFPRWLETHTKRDRRIAQLLASGESTNEVSEKFEVSPARVSQLRREFHDSWQEFHAEHAAVA